MRKRMLVTLSVFWLVSGCAPKTVIQCSSSDSTGTALDLIRTELEKAVAKASTPDNGTLIVDKASIRASIAKLGIALEDIRTTKEDPDSTKRFCTANLKITVPPQMLNDAEDMRSNSNLSTITALADQNNVQRDANKFSVAIDYDVQPTDDGKKVYASSADLPKINGFLSELLASSLLKSAIEQKRIQDDQDKAAQAQQQQNSLDEQRKADQAQAATDDQLATQTINAVWKTLPPENRTVLLDDQRAWVQKKAADCSVEAAGASTDATEQDTARLRCDARMTRDRTQYLRQLPGQLVN